MTGPIVEGLDLARQPGGPRRAGRAGRAGRAWRAWRAGALATVGLLATLVLAGPAAAADAVSLTATVNGQPAVTSSDAHPVQLYGGRLAEVRITVTNHGGSPVLVSSVRLEGEVLALPLFSYDTAVELTVAPDSTKSLAFPVSMSGVGSEATGLVVGSVALLGPNGGTLASEGVVTNVHGTLDSIYGLFGLAVLVLTVTSLVFGLIALARHTLPENRWRRGVRFLVPGFGVGLVLTFSLAALGVFTAGQGHWLPLLVVASAVGLAVGYLTPAPTEEEYDDYDEDVLVAQIVVVDEDPLDEDTSVPVGTSVGAGAVRPGAGAAASDSRATAAPDSRATAAPQSRATATPSSAAGGRETAPPDGRSTHAPEESGPGT